MSDDLRPLTVAPLLSLGVHALLLSLTFGGQGFGFPGFGFPWRERRIEATDLSVVLLPAPATAASATGTCGGKKVSGTGVYYTARAGAAGTDRFALQARLASGETSSRTFEVRIVE